MPLSARAPLPPGGAGGRRRRRRRGDDGADDPGTLGLLEMRPIGAYTLAKDDPLRVPVRMPREAVAPGATRKRLPPDMIEAEIPRVGAANGGS